jgi:hypothetical protein
MKTYKSDKEIAIHWLRNYTVTEEGQVIRSKQAAKGNGNSPIGKVLKPEVTQNGYNRVTLCLNGQTKRFQLHRLVAFLHVPNPDPDNYNVINHKDGNPQNNHKDNLEWCSYSENLQHAYDTLGRRPPEGETQGNSKLTDEIVYSIRHGRDESPTELAKEFGVSKATIQDALNYRTWTQVI